MAQKWFLLTSIVLSRYSCVFSGVLFATDWSRLIIPALPVHSGSPKFVFLKYLKNIFWCIFSLKNVFFGKIHYRFL